MHNIKLLDVNSSEKSLTQAVLQVTQMHGIYHAELARILHLQCEDIGEFSNANKILTKNSDAWLQAEKYIELFERLYILKNGDEALISNWLRRENTKLKAVPLYLMVDDLKIDEVITCVAYLLSEH